jgi:uncharacterized protein YeaO (DUF488 family)
MINIKRAYDPPATEDGERYLVDRLWPRGVKREMLDLTGWINDAAPSNELRKWVHQDSQRWEEFEHRYAAELESNPDAWKLLLEAARKGRITLLYASRDTEHNNAAALKMFLEKHLP